MQHNINSVSFILFFTELFKFKIQKYSTHKPYFLIPGHIYSHDNTHHDMHEYNFGIAIYFIMVNIIWQMKTQTDWSLKLWHL